MESVRIVKSPLHEDGIVATRILNGDEIAFIERPLYCQQTLQNKNDVLICSYCFSFLGTPELQMKVLLRIESRLSLLTTPGLNSNYNICGCLNTCGELYCSEHCRNLHQQNGHILLCTGTITEQEAPSHTLILFKTYAVETNEVFLLVAEVFASIISKFTINKIPIEEAVSFFREYVHNPWWEVVTVPDDREEGEFRDLLHTLAKDNYDLLSDALQLESTGLNSILSFDFMSRLIGTFEQNNVGVKLISPLSIFVQSLQPGDPLLPSIAAAAKQIVDNLEECEEDDFEDMDEDDAEMVLDESEDAQEVFVPSGDIHFDQLHVLIREHGADTIFPPLDGTSFYQGICKINHSCVPNVLVTYQSSPMMPGTESSTGLVAAVRVLRPILQGEELVQSYVDTELDYEERQKALRDYGFVCRCIKCTNRT